jgi:hypothetical protein
MQVLIICLKRLAGPVLLFPAKVLAIVPRHIAARMPEIRLMPPLGHQRTSPSGCVRAAYSAESGRLSASPSNKALERAKGIEPSYAAWEAAVLPLNYARGIPE